LLRPERGARAKEDGFRTKPVVGKNRLRLKARLRKAPPMASRRACPARRSSSATSTASSSVR
jgi:hypothetical protein